MTVVRGLWEVVNFAVDQIARQILGLLFLDHWIVDAVQNERRTMDLLEQRLRYDLVMRKKKSVLKPVQEI